MVDITKLMYVLNVH